MEIDIFMLLFIAGGFIMGFGVSFGTAGGRINPPLVF